MNTNGNKSDIIFEVDLTAATDRLKNSGKISRLSNAVRRLNEAFSAEVDLHQAKRLLEIGFEIVRKRPVDKETSQDFDTQLLAGAAFQHASLVYARIVTNNDDRSRVPLETGGTSELKSAHSRIVRLRHGGIGHYGFLRDHPNGPVSLDRVLLSKSADGLQLGHHYQRSHYKEKNLHDLSVVLDHGILAIKDIINQRRTDVFAQLDALDPKTRTEIELGGYSTPMQDWKKTTVSKSGESSLDRPLQKYASE